MKHGLQDGDGTQITVTKEQKKWFHEIFLHLFLYFRELNYFVKFIYEIMALGKQRKLAQVNASNASKIDWASNDKKLLEIKIWQVNKHFSDQNCS